MPYCNYIHVDYLSPLRCRFSPQPPPSYRQLDCSPLGAESCLHVESVTAAVLHPRAGREPAKPWETRRGQGAALTWTVASLRVGSRGLAVRAAAQGGVVAGGPLDGGGRGHLGAPCLLVPCTTRARRRGRRHNPQHGNAEGALSEGPNSKDVQSPRDPRRGGGFPRREAGGSSPAKWHSSVLRQQPTHQNATRPLGLFLAHQLSRVKGEEPASATLMLKGSEQAGVLATKSLGTPSWPRAASPSVALGSETCSHRKPPPRRAGSPAPPPCQRWPPN